MEANRTALRVAKETSFGVAPANPIYKELRRNSDALAFKPTTEVTQEIDSTRQINDLIRTGTDASGDVTMELSIENMDPWAEGLFCNPWLRSPEVIQGPSWKYQASATRIASISATTITLAATSVLSGSLINATGTAFVVGHLVRMTGLAAGNGLYPITAASTATALTITGGPTDAAPAVGSKIKVVGAQGASGDLVAVTAGGNGITSTVLNFTTLGLIVGQWVKISGEGGAFSYATAANNGYARISGIAASKLSFDITQGAWAADTGAAKTIRIYFGDSIRNGVTQYTYRYEKQYELSVGTRYSYFSGQAPSSISISGQTRGILQVTSSLVGAQGTSPAATRDAGASTESIAANSVLDASNSIPMIMEAGVSLGVPNYVSGFTLALDNGLRSRNAIGSPYTIGLGLGRVNVTGTLNTYFGDETMLNKLQLGTASGATIAFRDAANLKGEIWDVPRLKFNTGFPEVSGIDTDLMVDLGFQGLRDVANARDYTLMLSRFDYLL